MRYNICSISAETISLIDDYNDELYLHIKNKHYKPWHKHDLLIYTDYKLPPVYFFVSNTQLQKL